MKSFIRNTSVAFLILCLSWFATAAQAYTITTNYSFQLPQVNNAIDQDQWGTELNANWSSIDGLLLTATDKVSRATTTTDSITSTDKNKIIIANATGGAYAENLPAASSVENGFLVIIKKTDSSGNVVTATPAGADTIDGAASFIISAQYGFVALVSDHVSNWNIVSQSTVSVVAVKTVKKQIFTSGGTYTPSSGMLYAVVRSVGGGASGGGTQTGTSGVSYASGGGGGGEYAESTITAATMGSSQTVTIGAAGAAPSAGNNPGNAGGDTSLGSLVIAKGGSAGGGAAVGTSGSGGAGGTGGTGDLLINGESGGSGIGVNGEGPAAGGKGGNSSLGFGGAIQPAPIGSPGTIAGNDGNLYGGAGSGASGSGSASGSAARAGGAGSKGIVIITEYCSQ